MEKSSHISKLGCVTLIMAGLVPAGFTQGYQPVAQLEEGPRNLFDAESEETLAKFLNWGALNARPHLDVKTYYDSNLALKPEREEEDFVWRISPGVLFGVGEFRGDRGNFVSLDYTMTGSIYTKYHAYNALDHDVAMNAGWRASKLSIGLLQSYTTGNGKQVEAGSFVDQEVFLTGLAMKYDLSHKTFLELNGRQSIVSTENYDRPTDSRDPLNDVNEWAVEGWFNYRFSEKLTVGVGPTFGWRDIQTFDTPIPDVTDSPNQTFQQGLVKADYLLTQKLSLNGAVGFQFSQFEDGEDVGPHMVLEFGSTWRALENTDVSFSAYRRDQVSLSSAGQNYYLTGIRGTIQHTFREKYSLSFQGGYENYDYYNVVSSNLAERNDDYFWLSPVAAFQMDERTTLGVFYQYRIRESDDAAFDFDNHQVGLFARYAF